MLFRYRLNVNPKQSLTDIHSQNETRWIVMHMHVGCCFVVGVVKKKGTGERKSVINNNL